MTIDNSVQDVKVLKNPINFKSKYFVKESKKIEEDNERIDKAIIQSYPRRGVVYDSLLPMQFSLSL